MPAFDPDAFDFLAFDAGSPVPPDPGGGGVDPEDAASAGSGYSFVPTALIRSSLGLGFNRLVDGRDRLLDPNTLDYVRTANGEWVETQDSRTVFLIAMSVRLGQSPYDSEHGTGIAEQRVSGALTSPEYLQAETVRVGTELGLEGYLTELTVTVRDEDGQPFYDERGALVVKARWRDLGSGGFVEETFTGG